MAVLYRPGEGKNVSLPGSYKRFYEWEDAPDFENLIFEIWNLKYLKLRDNAKFEKEN